MFSDTVEQGPALNKQAAAALKESEDLFRLALDHRTAVLGPEHRDTADTACDLAGLLERNRQWAEAADMYERARRGYSACYGESDDETAHCTVKRDRCNSMGTLV